MDAVAQTTSLRAGVYRRFWSACLVLALALAAYFGEGALVGYTGDAYIRSDLIRTAPEVSGPIAAVHVRDNEHVDAQALLVTIDPTPFALAVALKKDAVASSEAKVVVRQEAEAEQAARIQTAVAVLDLAESEFERINRLVQSGDAAQEALDRVREARKSAQGALALARAAAIVGQRETDLAKLEARSANAALAVAEYELSRTSVRAGSAGYVNNLDLRPGRFAQAGEPFIGIVDDTQWRVIANFKEDVAASVPLGHPVWIWLDTQPWRLWSGRVQGVARGIARNEVPSQLLPYVAPTTDWIRLRRRLPVTITLDEPLPRDALYMGADARVLFLR
jgi:membrane fusion protein, multidrug efflux system